MPRTKRSKDVAGPDLSAARRETIANEAFQPELCKVQDAPPDGDDWLHEVKWDGYRIVATVAAGKVKLWSRNAIEWTAKVPELTKAIASLKLKSAQLDGEMVVLRKGRDDFNALQAKLSREAKEPLVYVLFDVPHLNGLSLRDVPLIERKKVLADLLKDATHPALRYSEHQIGDGKAMFAQATEAGLEGIICKRVRSSYEGARNGDWIKVKGRPSDEFVVIGFTEPKGARFGIGALLLAKAKDGALAYIGRVGTGFSDEQLRALRKELDRDVIDAPQAAIDLMERSVEKRAIWVRPRKVIEVFFQGIGGQGLLRQPAFKTFRVDKSVADIKSGDPKPAKKAVQRAKAAVAKPKHAKEQDADSDDVVITNPQREMFPGTGITKADIAAYYREVAPWMLTEIGGRPLSVVRCPGGVGDACFFQKHELPGWGPHIHAVDVKSERKKYLCIEDAAGLLELIQMNVIEIHPWPARSASPDVADRIVLDLDPHPDVSWPRVIAATKEVRQQLKGIGLEAFVRTSGGKGFHVVVPLKPAVPWDQLKRFSQAFAEAMAVYKPKEFVAVAGEKNRVGRIFVDWLRNGRGATAVATYSLRARPSAGVSMPLSWDELARIKSGDQFTIRNAMKHIRAWHRNPWADIGDVAQELPTHE